MCRGYLFEQGQRISHNMPSVSQYGVQHWSLVFKKIAGASERMERGHRSPDQTVNGSQDICVSKPL